MRASAFVVAVIAAFGLAGCSRTKPVGPKIDPALLTLMFPDTVMAAGARIEALEKTPVYQKHLAKLDLPGVDEFARKTGMNPRKDLWELLFISDGKHQVLLGRGRFADEMQSKLEREGATRTGYKMYGLLGNEQNSVVFLSDSTAATGDVPSLKALIDSRGTSKGPPPAIAERLKDIPADAQLWAVYTGTGIPLNLPIQGNLSNVTKLLSAIQSASLYFDLRDGAKGKALGICANDQDAKMVHDALKAFVGFGRLSAPSDQPDLLRVYDGIEVTQQMRQVSIKIEESQDLLDAFLRRMMPR